MVKHTITKKIRARTLRSAERKAGSKFYTVVSGHRMKRQKPKRKGMSYYSIRLRRKINTRGPR